MILSKSDFLLNPAITFLNFGSFGSCPQTIFDDYQKWQRALEFEPVQFMTIKGPALLKESRDALGAFVNCNGDDLVFVSNPSYAINIVAKSLKLNRGDEILSTNLEYGAMDRIWNYYCKKAGAKFVRQPIDLPVISKEVFFEQFWKGLSKNTKAIFISHITSATALRLPVAEICATAKEKGLLTIVDGAHIPGHIPLNLLELKADIYTGACHKWMLTPKGSSFLYVKKELQHLFDPLVISWGYESVAPSHSQFIDYHQMQGTRDFSAFLTLPKAIAVLTENNWEKIAFDCRLLAHSNYQRFCDLFGTSPLCPINDAFLGQMCSIPIRTSQPEKLKQFLYEKYQIEVPVFKHEEHVFLRYSIHLCNSQEDLDKLFNALEEIIIDGKFV